MRALPLLLIAASLLAQSREGFVNVPGGPVWYRVIGSGKDIPLLVLHGGPGGTSCGFAPLAPLSASRPIVLYDQLGSGRSGRPTDTRLWRLDRFLDELDAVRKQLRLKRIHLMGHSWGGALAAAYALRPGVRGIESLILASPLLSTPDWIRDAEDLRRELPPDVQATLRRHEAAGTTTSAEYRQAEREYVVRFLIRNPNPPPNPDCAGAPLNRVIYQHMWGPSEFHATGNLLSFDVTPSLSQLRLPVLLMVGEFDEARPSTAARYQKLIPGSRLAVIPGAAHSLFTDNLPATLEALQSFLNHDRKP